MCAKKAKSGQTKELPQLRAFPQYLRTNDVAAQLSTRFSFERELQAGKTGVVYLLKSVANPSLHLCLKTIRPQIQEPKVRAEIKESLKKECEILLPMSHRCLPTVFEYDFDVEPPYYVCEYHPGETFADFHDAGKRLSTTQAAFVILSLIDVLRYLHSSGRAHCDLHSRNVMLGSDVVRDGILVIDFGSGHRQSDSSGATPNRGNEHFKDPSGQRTNRMIVDRQQARTGFEQSDFNALGKLLGLMEDCFISDSSRPTRIAYRDFHQSLQQGRLSDWNDVELAFRTVLDPYRVLSANEDLFQSRDARPQAITLPVSRGVAVGDPPLAVVNTKAFQRLRGIKQLSFCDWLFPGATHTRFEHSLGVFGIAKRAIETLVHQPQFRDSLSPEQVRGGLLAALLHDVGHYPFAHVMEHYAAGRLSDSTSARTASSHESSTLELIENDAELKSAVTEHWGEKALTHAIKTLEKNTPILSDLLDGPIDIDKMDYLTRDSLHCGVKYGEGLDLDLLLRSLVCVDDGKHLGVAGTGVSAVEGLMVLQDQMLASIYWHETVRGIISMFHAVVAYLVGRNVDKFIELVGELKKCRSDHEAVATVFLPKAEAYQGAVGEAKKLSSLVRLFANPVFSSIYISVATYRWTDDPLTDQRVNVFQTIVNSSTTSRSLVPIDWRQVQDLRAAYVNAFKEKGMDVNRLDIVIDVPYGKNKRPMLRVVGGDGRTEEDFVHASHLKETIFTNPTQHLAPVRVYVAPEIHDKAGSRMGSIVRSAEERFFSTAVPSTANHSDWA